MSGTTKAAAGNALTDGTGVSALTAKKLFKDFVADFLLSAATAVGSIQLANVFGIPTTNAELLVVGTAILGAAIRAGYRAALRWATS